MSDFRFKSLEAIRARGAITAADVSALRMQTFGSPMNISKEFMEDIIDLDNLCSVRDSSWQDFYTELLSEFIIEQSEPRGYITVENAEWLMACLQRGDQVPTYRGVELLIHILDKSRWSPSSLVAFALDQVKDAVINGEGPLRDGRELTKGVVGEAEVALLRRILFAFGGDGNMAITKQEAEILFDINEMTSEADNDPAWTDLFAKAIANYLMCSSGYRVPTREAALKRELWLEERDGTTGFIAKMVAGGLKSVWNAYAEQSDEERALARLEQEKIKLITAEIVTDNEANWLATRIMRDGKICENEKALLEFLRERSPQMHPAFEPLLAQAV